MKEKEVVEQDKAKKTDIVLGKKIQKVRKAKSLSKVDLADKLNLHVTTIECLEAEKFDELPAPAFVRGYIRAIAIELALDVDEILNIYAAHNQADPNLGSTSAAEKQKKASDPSMVWGTAAMLAAVVVLLIVWGVNSLNQSGAEQASTEGIVASVLPDIQLSLDPALENTDKSLALEEEPSEASALELAPEPDLATPSEVTPASINPAAPNGKDSLTISAKGPSWADIRDSTGFQLVYGLLDKNDQQQRVTGKAPFSVFLGDAKQVELKFQGKTFNFSRHVRANNVAKFSVK
jgi:cytoskeleton protein RodZ